MNIKFIYGRSGSGKTTYVINEIEGLYNQNKETKKMLVIVPEQLTFQTEKKFIERFGFLGGNIEIASFKRLAYRLFKEVGGNAKTYIDGSGKSMLLFKIIDDLKDDLKVFSGCTNQTGFINNILDIICEFKRYNVAPEDLQQLKENLPIETFIYDKFSDICLIYDRFNESLSNRYLDSEEDLNVAALKLKNSKNYRDIDIWIDEFSGFTPQQYLILKELCNNNCKLNFSLNMDFSDDMDICYSEVFSPIIYTRDKLMQMAMEVNATLLQPVKIPSDPPYKFRDTKDLAYLEANYFRYPFEPYKETPENLQLFKAKNIYSEVEHTARKLVSLCRDNNAKPSEIAVISRNLESYESLVKSIFNEYDIPYFIDEKKDISSNIVIVLITSLMEIINNNWNYQSVFRHLKTDLLDIDVDSIHILENYVLASGIRGKKAWTDDATWYKKIVSNYKLKYRLKDYGDEEKITKLLINYLENEEFEIENFENEHIIHDIKTIKIICEARNKLLTPILKVIKGFSGKKPVKDFCQALFTYIEDINVFGKLQEHILVLNGNGEEAIATEYSKIWNFFIDLLDQMVEVIGDEIVNVDTFIDILKLGLKDHKMGFIPQSLEEVMVSSVERFNGYNIKYLFVLGVNDGVFPKNIDKEGLLTDRDRGFLKEKGIKLAKDTRSMAFEEQYLIYKTLTLSKGFLSVSYPIANNDEKALRPSIIISRLKSLFPEIKEYSDVIDCDYKDLVSNKVSTFNELITYFQEVSETQQVSPTFGEVYRWFINSPLWKDRMDNVISAFSYCNEEKSIGSSNALKLYGDDKKLSVSRIENYIRCPFGYFVKYGLKAKEREIFALTPPDLGTFIHNVLDRFARTVEKESSFSEIDEKLCEDIVEKSFNIEMEESSGNIFKASSRFNYFGNRVKTIVNRASKLIVRHMNSGNFIPLGYEIEFGFKEGTYSPIELTMSNGDTVKLIGKIDRADKLLYNEKDYLRIIDYKSGNKEFDLSEVYYGLQIQLLTYLDALLEKEKENTIYPVFPAGILYFKIDNPIIKTTKNLTDDEIEKEIMKLLKMKGLILSDTRIVREMDSTIQGASLILPVGFKKDGNFTSASRVATKEQFDLLRNHVRRKLVETCEKIYDGNIDISPCKTLRSAACEYCDYPGVCAFDSATRNNEYRYLGSKDDDEIWDLISKEEAEDNE